MVQMQWKEPRSWRGCLKKAKAGLTHIQNSEIHRNE